jgi:uncharacterized protein
MQRNPVAEYGFIGSGVGYRPGRGVYVNGEGGLGIMHAEQDIAKSIFIILSTAPGERVMRPDFGCGIHDLVFSTPSPQLFGLVSYYVEQALGRYEPRIEVLSVNSDVDANSQERLMVDISYRLVQTNREHNLVYPFYIIPRGRDD